jgi:hypothetical protein
MTSARLAFATLVLITCASAAIRLWQARESLWLDELHTAWCATGPLIEVAPRAAIGNQSPLFFWLEWLLVQLLGPSELTLRLPSIVAGTLLGVALYVVAQRWTGQPWLGVLAAWLVVFEPKQLFNAAEPRHLFFTTEARPYALIELLAVIHVALFLELLARPTLVRRTLFVLGGVLLFHLHYTAILLVPAELALYVLFRATCPPPDAYGGRFLALDLFLLLAFCLPAFGHLQGMFARRGNWSVFVPQQPATAILTLWPASFAAAIVLPNVDWFIRRSAAPKRELAPLAVLLWALVPVSLAWLATATDTARLLFPRYVVASAPAATLLAVMCLRLLPWKSLQVVVGIGIALFALRTSGVIEQFHVDGRFIADRRGDWRAAIRHFNEQPGHDSYPVLVHTGLIESDALRSSHDRRLADYCLFPVTSLYPIDAERDRLIPLPRTNAGRLEPAVRQRIETSGGAWLIASGKQGSGFRKGSGFRVQGSGQDTQWHVASARSFGTLHVIELRRGSEAAND